MAKTFIVRDKDHPLFGIRVKNNNGTKAKYAPNPKTDDTYRKPLAAIGRGHKSPMNPIDRAIRSLSKSTHAGIINQRDKLTGEVAR